MLLCSLNSAGDLLVKACGVGLLRESHDGLVVDARGALGLQEGREVVLAGLSRHLAELPTAVVIAGMADSGTPWAALVAHAHDLRFLNVLVDGPRTRGLRRQLEPDTDLCGAAVALVDNWVQTAATLTTAVHLLRAADAEVVAALVISAAPTTPPAIDNVPVHVAFPFDDLNILRQGGRNR